MSFENLMMWSLRSFVIKVIKDFESVKLSLYIYI